MTSGSEDERWDDSRPAAAGQSGYHEYDDSDNSDGHWQPQDPDDDDDDDAALTLGNTWRLNFTMREVYVSKATSVWDFLVDLVWNTSMVMIIFVDPERGEDSSIMQILMALARVTALCEVEDDEPTEDMFSR